jgi:hypothetical protein
VWLLYKEPSVAGHQTHHEPMLLNFIAAYSINSRVVICFINIYILLMKPVDSVIVNNKQRYTLVVQFSSTARSRISKGF